MPSFNPRSACIFDKATEQALAICNRAPPSIRQQALHVRLRLGTKLLACILQVKSILKCARFGPRLKADGFLQNRPGPPHESTHHAENGQGYPFAWPSPTIHRLIPFLSVSTSALWRRSLCTRARTSWRAEVSTSNPFHALQRRTLRSRMPNRLAEARTQLIQVRAR